MFQLLNQRPDIDRGGHQPPFIYDTYQRIRENVTRVQEWVRSQELMVRGEHPLVVVISLISGDINLDIFDYHKHVVSRAAAVARSIYGANDNYDGVAKNTSMLYGGGYEEAILISDFSYSLFDIEDNWRSWAPLKIRRHPITELSIPSLYNQDIFGEKGTVVLELDIVALAMQYRQWRLANAGREYPPSVRQFVIDYPLVNAIPQHVNVAVFNRLYGTYHGSLLGGQRKLVPIITHDYTSRVDDYLLERTRMFIDRPNHFEFLLSNVLLPYGDLWDHITLPKVGFTSQTMWTIYLMRSLAIEWLVRVDYDGFRTGNRKHKNLISRSVNHAKNNNIFSTAMGRDRNDELIRELEDSILNYL